MNMHSIDDDDKLGEEIQERRSSMANTSTWYDVNDEDLYALPAHDPIGVLGSTRAVVEQGELVWINQEHIELLSNQWAQERDDPKEIAVDTEDTAHQPPQWYTQYHFHDGTERTVNWILVLDALNFCFWAEKDQPRWSIDYQGEQLNGYWAEAASLTRAVEEGIPLWDAEYLSTINQETVEYIFRGTETIPLLEQRVHNAREVGHVLLKHYDGQFANAIKQTEQNAVKLVHLLARDFPSFNDSATYRKREVRFLKRAQICIADMHTAFGGHRWGAFTDIDQLTAFADYKIPQVLRQANVLEYHPSLTNMVDNQVLLEPGSEEEIEIRAGTVWACELLRRAMLKQGRAMSATEIDQRLWFIGQNSANMRPYHRTRTIYY